MVLYFEPWPTVSLSTLLKKTAMVAPLCRVARKNRESMDPRRNFAAAWVLFCEKQSLFNNQSPHTVADEHYLSAFPTLNQDR